MPTKKKVKKIKSVERQREDRSINAGDLIAIKAPLSKGSQNVNKQTVQIVFPSDMELRKVRKRKRTKPKPKKDSEREQLIEQLKALLAEYDKDRHEADEKKIKVPDDIGLPTINASELKTNDDIKKFIDDVATKLQRLRELIAKSTTTAAAPSLWGLPQGGFRTPQQIAVQPQQIVQPQIIPPAGIPTQIPILIPTTGAGIQIPARIPTLIPTTGAGAQAPVDPTLAALQQIAKETQTELEHKGIDTSSLPPPATIKRPAYESVFPSAFDEIRKQISIISGDNIPADERIREAVRLREQLIAMKYPVTGVYSSGEVREIYEFQIAQKTLLTRLDSIISQSGKDLPATGTQLSPPPEPTIVLPSQERPKYGLVKPPPAFDEIMKQFSIISADMPSDESIRGAVRLREQLIAMKYPQTSSAREIYEFQVTQKTLITKLDSIISQGAPRVTTPTPAPPSLNLTKSVLDIDGKATAIEAPNGWGEQVKKVLKYQKDIIYDAEERPKGYFHIPIASMQNLIRERELINNQYSMFMRQLNTQQVAYIDAKYGGIDKRLREILMEEPKETLKYVFDKQGRPYKDITQAGEKPKIEAETEKALAAGKSLKDPFINAQVKEMSALLDKSDKRITDIEAALNGNIQKKILTGKIKLDGYYLELGTMNKLINDKFQTLPDNAQALTGVAFENTVFQIRNVQEKISKIKSYEEKIRQSQAKGTDVITEALWRKIDVVQEQEQPPAGYAPYQGRDKDIVLLKNYVEDEKDTFRPKVKEAVKNIFGESFFEYITNKSKIDKKTIIGQAIKDVGSKSASEYDREFRAEYIKIDRGWLKPHQMTREEWDKHEKEETKKAAIRAGAEEGHEGYFA